MEHPIVPSNGALVNEADAYKPQQQRRGFSSLGLRTRSILAGIPYPLWSPIQDPTASVDGAKSSDMQK